MLPAASFEVLFHNAHLKTCERSALRQRCDGMPWQNTMPPFAPVLTIRTLALDVIGSGITGRTCRVAFRQKGEGWQECNENRPFKKHTFHQNRIQTPRNCQRFDAMKNSSFESA